MKYLPSRKFLKTVAFLLFLGAVSFMVFGSKSIILTRNNNAENTVSINNNSPSFFKDSDNDGLHDWEETLLGTDPSNEDTGGKGVLDGIAYKTPKLYPDVELPPDLLQEFLNFSGRITSRGAGDTLNITDTLSKEVSLRYGVLGQGQELEKNTFDQLENALASDFSKFTPPDTYTEKNINITPNDNTEDINAYIASVIETLNEKEVLYEKKPLEIARTFMETGDENLGIELEDLEKEWGAVTKSLSSLQAPQSVLGTHLSLLNASDHITRALGDMRQGENDPVRALLGSAAFIHYSEKKQKAVTDLVAFFRKYNS